MQDNVLHLTVQKRHLHHCAGKFPTLNFDGGELSLRTIVQENFLHFTQKLKYFLHVPEVCFPHLASEY